MNNKLSKWFVVHEYCATRCFRGTDPNVEANRVAFIEKTPRVLIAGTWIYGPKGSGGCEGSNPKNELYGFYPPSRKWCDEQLRKLGYELDK